MTTAGNKVDQSTTACKKKPLATENVEIITPKIAESLTWTAHFLPRCSRVGENRDLFLMAQLDAGSKQIYNLYDKQLLAVKICWASSKDTCPSVHE